MPNSSRPFQDTMQVCLNGHEINDRFFSSPEYNKKYCTECGKPTITQCSSCNANIPGDMVNTGIVAIGFGSSVPKICAECGNKFPWYEVKVKQDAEAREYQRQKDEDEKIEKQMSGAKRFDIRIEGHGNVLNMGSMLDNVIANSIKLNAAGEKEIAEALDEVSRAVGNADDLKESQKREFLEQLNTLSNEAVKPVDKRLPSSVLGPIIKYALSGLSAVGSVAKIWSTWGPQIEHFFTSH